MIIKFADQTRKKHLNAFYLFDKTGAIGFVNPLYKDCSVCTCLPEF